MEKIDLKNLHLDEQTSVQKILDNLEWNDEMASAIQKDAVDAITAIRKTRRKSGSLESFFQQYGLNTQEGLALMSLAEALLRIPDSKTANSLIRDKISGTQWLRGKTDDKDWLTKVAGLGLKLSSSTMNGLFSKLGEPVIRQAMARAMKVLGKQFVVGETISDSMKKATTWEEKGFRFSYDMLGEGARTDADATRYFENYKNALEVLAEKKSSKNKKEKLSNRPGISVKISALHPRFELLQKETAYPEIIKKLTVLCDIAAKNNLTLTIDAEEIARIEPTLDIFESLLKTDIDENWQGLGIAIQAYHKVAPTLIHRVISLAEIYDRKIQIRLVKGAYWDTEIKHAQISGHETYPVYTRKCTTDVSYLYCAQIMLENCDVLYPMFGTHNAHTVFSILNMAENTSGDTSEFEFQKLYGMGDALYNYVIGLNKKINVCAYAPVGPYGDLLPYLVRRMLENGANSSFVHKIYDKEYAPEQIANDPVQKLNEIDSFPHAQIPLPKNLFGKQRENSMGLNFDDSSTLLKLQNNLDKFNNKTYDAYSLVNGRDNKDGTKVNITNPATSIQIGQAVYASYETIDKAAEQSEIGHQIWSETSAHQRADTLIKIATLLDENREELIYLCNKEGGRTLKDCDDEVREAIDFCRYYAVMGCNDFDENGKSLISPTGETNKYYLKSRGVFVCISPWNFPIAIFTGQIVAALMAGNAVIAKPAEQTPLTAYFITKLMMQAGVPSKALTLVLGDGQAGAALIEIKNIAGVVFTGSTHVAHLINQSLAQKSGAIPRLIAETGGQNAMIVDSSALTEQVVDDVVNSAFGSAGQRCSACRLLYLQDDIADKTIEMLKGAMQKIKVGDPSDLSTDIGPLINDQARMVVQHHKTRLDGFGTKISEVPVDDDIKTKGTFFAPIAYEIPDLSVLEREIFGPVLHIIRYRSKDIDSVIKEINETGYGLTFGIHSRIQTFIDKVTTRIKTGNLYVNKSTIGAVVGVQPFGGRGLSGTGPKAGGPQYLRAFASEKVISTDITASGGNASLVMLDD